VEEVEVVIAVKSERCRRCQHRLEGEDGQVGRVLTRALACVAVSTKGSTSLASLGFPMGRCSATMKPANRRIVCVDNFAVGQHLALRQPAGLVVEPLMDLEGGGKLGVQARPLVGR
jgi:hypothetical protein